MSNTDSFIEEVTEEVRRDRLFAYARKYGWIVILAVILIVSGAGYNEWRKADARARAEAAGDAILSAVALDETSDRVDALLAVDLDSPEAQVVSDFLLAAMQVSDGQLTEAGATLDSIAVSDAELPEIYRQIAVFKSATAHGGAKPVSERRLALESLAAPGQPLSLLAQEQLALLEVEEGNVDGALERLQNLVQNAEITAGLRQRATQLIVALGGEPLGQSAVTPEQ